MSRPPVKAGGFLIGTMEGKKKWINIKRRYLCAAVKEGKVVDLKFCEDDTTAFEMQCLRNGEFVMISDLTEFCGEMDGRWDEVHPLPKKTKKKEEPPVIPLPQDSGWSKHIKCKETGEVFDSFSDLMKTITGMGRWAVNTRILNGTPVNGKHYYFVSKDDGKQTKNGRQ